VCRCSLEATFEKARYTPEIIKQVDTREIFGGKTFFLLHIHSEMSEIDMSEIVK